MHNWAENIPLFHVSWLPMEKLKVYIFWNLQTYSTQSQKEAERVSKNVHIPLFIYKSLIAKLSGKYTSFPRFFPSYAKTNGVHFLKLGRDIPDNPKKMVKEFQKMYTFHYLFIRA